MPQVRRLYFNILIPPVPDQMSIEVLHDLVEFFAACWRNEGQDQAIASDTKAKIAAFVHEHVLHTGSRINIRQLVSYPFRF